MIWFNRVVCFFLRRVLGLRYRVEVRGVAVVAAKGRGGILFLPNHPALIDPVLVFTHLYGRFAARPLADRDQVAAPGIRQAAGMARVIALPDIAVYGPVVKAEVDVAFAECSATLRGGGNLILYPAGRIYRSRFEDLGGNTGVERLLRECPECRVVLVRTRGLWGSRFGNAWGVPHLGTVVGRGLGRLLLNGLFFMPKRPVTLDLWEPETLPAREGVALNEFLEKFYNEDAPPNTVVPDVWWERGGPKAVPEPEAGTAGGGVSEASPETRRLVLEHLRQLSGRAEIADTALLARDLGLDSLARTELLTWLGKEFGPAAASGSPDALGTVEDVFRAACGESLAGQDAIRRLKPPPAAWFAGEADTAPAELPPGETVTDLFLAQAKRNPGRVVVADQTRGAATFRDLVTALLVLVPRFATLEGERLGIMLPASFAADLAWLGVLFAGRAPVMVNWTVGAGVMTRSLDAIGVKRVLTSRQLVAKLKGMGINLAQVEGRFDYLEDMGQAVTLPEKLGAALRARLGLWGALRRTPPSAVAVILFTSGSEALPKAVPLTHANLLANLRATLSFISLRRSDSLLGMLPPFHSFGLTVTMAAPLCAGLRVVHHPNPLEAGVLAALTARFRVSIILGTPTFLAGIARAAKPSELESVRLAVTGAEKCPDRVYALVKEKAPHAVVVEGYGITECSPIVAANSDRDPRPGSIGKVLPNVEWVIADEAFSRALPADETGLLLVRGPSIFGGYLNKDAPNPFVTFAGKEWYNTGDLVSVATDGVLTFRGRKKRFVKIGGEMVSLPAVEEALERALPPAAAKAAEKGPVLAVAATKDEARPELVLFATFDWDRAAANDAIAAAGLSPIHNLRRVERVEELPLLGSGKTDYRALDKRLAGG